MATFQSFLFVVAVVAVFLSVPTATSATSRSPLKVATAATCSYTIFVQTGDVADAGTDSKISLAVVDRSGQSIWVNNLEDWGQMGRGHDYFERGNLDIFEGTTNCLVEPFCTITVISDGTGNKPGWYLQYVLIKFSVGGQIYRFDVNSWLEPGSGASLDLSVMVKH